MKPRIFSLLFLSASSCFYYYGDKLLKSDQSYNAKVLQIQEYKGWVFINDSVALSGNNIKYEKEKKVLYKILKIGDSVSTAAFNDSIYVFKPTGEVLKFLKHSSSIK
jgi:hypothetical protein